MAEIIIPDLAESITEGTISNWLKKPGDPVEVGEPVLELETDKINVDIISDYNGVLKEILKEEGDTVNVGEAVAIVEEGVVAKPEEKLEEPKAEVKEPVHAATETAAAQAVETQSTPVKTDVVASPAARKLAREKGIDITQVPTPDPLGRVRRQDVASYDTTVTPATAKQATPAPVQVPDAKPVERIKMTRRRQTIAKNLLNVKQSTAMLTTFNEVDLTNIMAIRKKRQEEFVKEHDIKLGYMSFFTKAVVAALKKFPLLNAEIQGDELVVKKYYDIGIAVSTDAGLVVPVVRDADRKNFAEIENDIAELAMKARENKLALSDLQGGTFTITNGGVFGSLFSTPILNGSQVGILGMHTIKYRPVAIDRERIEIRPMMYIALSYDHRIVDGKEAVSFLATVKALLEDPEKLLLEG